MESWLLGLGRDKTSDHRILSDHKARATEVTLVIYFVWKDHLCLCVCVRVRVCVCVCVSVSVCVYTHTGTLHMQNALTLHSYS